jgi:hypothetical protein
MTDNESRQSLLGNLVHSAITQEYLGQHRRQHVIADTLVHSPHGLPYGISNNWHDGRPRDAYLGMILEFLQSRKPSQKKPWLFPYEPSLPGFSRRPEMANVEQHVAYEIKPDSARWERDGVRQLQDFLGLLRQADAEFRAVRDKRLVQAQLLRSTEQVRIINHYGKTLYERCESTFWHNGTWRPHSPITVHFGAKPVLIRLRIVPTGGLILWKEIDEDERDRYRPPYVVPISSARPGDQQGPNKQERPLNKAPDLRLPDRLAARLRDEVRLLSDLSERTAGATLLRLVELRQLLLEFLRRHGQTLLLSALATALVAALVLAPPLAAAFAALVVAVLLRDGERQSAL